MKKVGITGPPGSGKTTLWKAITGGRAHGDVAVVALPDPRLDVLVELNSSSKRVPVQMEFVDVHSPGRTAGAAIARLREMDAIVAVLPAFGGLDLQAGRQNLSEELILADMGPVESRLERAKKDRDASREIPSLEAALSVLESGQFLREKDWDEVALATFSPLALLTLKPILLVINVEEGPTGARGDLDEVRVTARLEAEVGEMDQQEAAELLGEFGIDAPATERVPSEVYRLMDLITFFTLNQEESRAWELLRGAKAPEAAGVIHSDMQRGFIRAEVSAFDKVEAAGSWDRAKTEGQVRVEGKDYVIADGDVVRVRFSV